MHLFFHKIHFWPYTVHMFTWTWMYECDLSSLSTNVSTVSENMTSYCTETVSHLRQRRNLNLPNDRRLWVITRTYQLFCSGYHLGEWGFAVIGTSTARPIVLCLRKVRICKKEGQLPLWWIHYCSISVSVVDTEKVCCLLKKIWNSYEKRYIRWLPTFILWFFGIFLWCVTGCNVQ